MRILQYHLYSKRYFEASSNKIVSRHQCLQSSITIITHVTEVMAPLQRRIFIAHPIMQCLHVHICVAQSTYDLFSFLAANHITSSVNNRLCQSVFMNSLYMSIEQHEKCTHCASLLQVGDLGEIEWFKPIRS